MEILAHQDCSTQQERLKETNRPSIWIVHMHHLFFLNTQRCVVADKRQTYLCPAYYSLHLMIKEVLFPSRYPVTLSNKVPWLPI